MKIAASSFILQKLPAPSQPTTKKPAALIDAPPATEQP
jgi:hypothetical protein